MFPFVPRCPGLWGTTCIFNRKYICSERFLHAAPLCWIPRVSVLPAHRRLTVMMPVIKNNLGLNRHHLFPSSHPARSPHCNMDNQTAPRRDLPEVKFRVLIAGRANAGKTSILQRVCDTTKSPETYRIVDYKHTKVESRSPPESVHIVLRGQQIQLNPTSDVRCGTGAFTAFI